MEDQRVRLSKYEISERVNTVIRDFHVRDLVKAVFQVRRDMTRKEAEEVCAHLAEARLIEARFVRPLLDKLYLV